MGKNDTLLTKTEVTRALALGIQQLSFDGGEEDVFATSAKQHKGGITVECTDGSVIELKIDIKTGD